MQYNGWFMDLRAPVMSKSRGDMSKKWIVGCILVSVGLCAVLVGFVLRPARASQSVPGGRIIGTLTDRGTNRPVVGEVGVTSLDQGRLRLKHARASLQGEFVIDGIESGQFHLVTKADGYAVEHRNVSLNQGETLRVDFVLKPVKKLRGVVRGPNGGPLSGAGVSVRYPAEIPPPGNVTSTYQWEAGEFLTGALGTFEIDVHPDKEFIIETSHPDFVGDVSRPVTIPADRTEISTILSLRNGSNLTGEVKNAAGVPIPGAQIRLMGLTARSASPRFTSTETLSQRIKYGKSRIDGSFNFRQLTPGRKMLVVIHPGYRQFKQIIDVTSSQSSSQVPVVLPELQVQNR